MIQIGNERLSDARIIGIELLGGLFTSETMEIHILREMFKGVSFQEMFMLGRSFPYRIGKLFTKKNQEKTLSLINQYTEAVYQALSTKCEVNHSVLSALKEALEHHFSIAVFSTLPGANTMELLRKLELNLDVKMFTTELDKLNYFPEPDLIRACVSFYNAEAHETMLLTSCNTAIIAAKSARVHYYALPQNKELKIQFS